jgi:hypothetical protein
VSEVKHGRKSPEERLQELDKKLEQIKAKKQQIQTQLQAKERRARTRRLIQVGAIFEKRFPSMEQFTLEQVSELADELHKLVMKEKTARAAAEQNKE